MIEETLYVFKVIVSIFLCTQCVSVMLFLIIEWSIVDLYELGTFKNPTSIFDKITNFFMALLLGSGYFFYKKFERQNWFVRKMNMFIILILQGVLSIIIFYIITIPVDLIFNLPAI